MPTAVVVLAAGQGTRMKSDLPKVLHPVGSAPLLAHVLATARAMDPERIVVVTGHEADRVAACAAAVAPDVAIARQSERLGTAHAVRQAAEALAGFSGDVLVLYGDTPLIRPATLRSMLDARRDATELVVLGFEAEAPGGYGRLVLDAEGHLLSIVEARDATPAQREIALCNSGVIAADAALLFELLDEVGKDNAKGEYYLTDVVGLARGRGLTARVITCPEAETMGINSRAELAAAEAAFQARARRDAMDGGVTMTDPASVWLALDTVLGRDVTIGPNVVFREGVRVADGATIHGFCHLERCSIGPRTEVGPFARLRPGAEIGAGAKVGNFVEVKNARLDTGAKVNHLSYIGDARVGEAANIGAGTITCNYDGVFKHHTEIGARAFIGSNTALVAPVTVGADALIGAGSVIGADVPEAALAVARGRQVTKPELGKRIIERLRALKASRAAE